MALKSVHVYKHTKHRSLVCILKIHSIYFSCFPGMRIAKQKYINPFPALIKSKNLLNVKQFCFYFTSSRWSAVSVNHSTPPESVMNQLQDGGGFVA